MPRVFSRATLANPGQYPYAFSLTDLLKGGAGWGAQLLTGRLLQDNPYSEGANAASGAAQGASVGAMVGGPWGAAIGGVLGGLGGLFSTPDEPSMREMMQPRPTRNITPQLEQLGQQYRYRLPQSDLARYLAMYR